MLTRFTPAVRSVMAQAYERAVQEGSAQIGETHLIDALLDDEEGAVLLQAVAGNEARAQIAAEFDEARRAGGLTATETDALAALGVDVGALVGGIEEQLGAGALAGSGAGSSRHWQRPAMSGTVLRVLDEAERQAAVVGGRSLGIEHVALAVVSTPSLLSESLARHGITVETVRDVAAVERRRGACR